MDNSADSAKGKEEPDVEPANEKGVKPPPPADCGKPVDGVDDWCKKELIACDKQLTDPDTCKQIALKCQLPEPGEPPRGPAPKPGACGEIKLSCEIKGLDAKECEAIVNDCLNPGTPSPDPCDDVKLTCEIKGLDEKTCEAVMADCKRPPAPPQDGCAEKVKWCYSEGLDPKTCEAIAVECKQALSGLE